MKPQLHIQATNIVLRGNFNPAIFHPAWLAANTLIRQPEADAAEIEIVHPEATVFKTDWLEFNVTRDRLQASTSQEAFYEATRDLILGLLTLLSHTPVTLIGLNCDYHYRAPSDEYWHRIGHQLAPKPVWGDLLLQPGMRSLTMEGQRPDKHSGYIRVTVEPSNRVMPGIYVSVNDHFQLDERGAKALGTESAREVLTSSWADSLARADTIAVYVAELGKV